MNFLHIFVVALAVGYISATPVAALPGLLDTVVGLVDSLGIDALTGLVGGLAETVGGIVGNILTLLDKGLLFDLPDLDSIVRALVQEVTNAVEALLDLVNTIVQDLLANVQTVLGA